MQIKIVRKMEKITIRLNQNQKTKNMSLLNKIKKKFRSRMKRAIIYGIYLTRRPGKREFKNSGPYVELPRG